MDAILKLRQARLRKLLQERDLDTLLVQTAENRRYLSGFTGEDTQFDESAGSLLITQNALVLATDSRFVLQAAGEAPDARVYQYKNGLAKALPEIFAELKTRRLGFESVRMSHDQYLKCVDAIQSAGMEVVFEPVDGLVEGLRMIKSEPEIEAMRQALDIAETAFKDFIQTLSLGISEQAAAWGLEQALREAGADALSFPVIAAFGTNAALPHAIPSKRVLGLGDGLLFDWGVKKDGYCSDITRTLTWGKPDKTFQKIYEIVQEAQQLAIEAVKPGASSRSVDEKARSFIAAKGYGDHFGHGLGHGVGLAVHEKPGISPVKDFVLEPGMIFTVEPGIYLEDWGGIRLENMVLVTDTGVEVLNQSGLDHYEIT